MPDSLLGDLDAGPTCIGFGEREDCCDGRAYGPRFGSPLWCDPCEQERRDHITAQMARVTASFEAKGQR